MIFVRRETHTSSSSKMAKRKRTVEEEGDESADKHEPKRTQKRRSLFAHSLPPDTTTESLIEHFSNAFPIKHAAAVINPQTKLCKGYGFVTFADPDDAQHAQEEFDQSEFRGRKIRLEIAQPRRREMDDNLAELSRGILEPAEGPKEDQRQDNEDKRESQPTKLIVRNLPWSIKKPEQLERLFLSYGKMKQVSLPTKKKGLLSGFGFVTLRGRKNAEKALSAVNGREIDGRTLAVDWAVKKDIWQAQQPEDGENTAKEAAGDLKTQNVQQSSMNENRCLDPSNAKDEEDEGSQRSSSSESYNAVLQDQSSTIFIRNLPFTTSDDELWDHFSQFGHLRYARVVLDPITEKPRGTGFLCFLDQENTRNCLNHAPKSRNASNVQQPMANGASKSTPHSLLQSEDNDSSGKYTLEGRVLLLSPAVDRSQAVRFSEANSQLRMDRQRDKRRLYLLSEGILTSDSPLRQILSPSEIAMRESSSKQRKSLIQSNPTLHLSLTRLSIRNMPRSVTSKELKALAREAVVGFAKDVKANKRTCLSKEELARSNEATSEADKMRKMKRKGVVKQAKVVFEGRKGGKVDEKSGAGRSRGYGFVEYYSHRSALMGLRWLNGHPVAYRAREDEPGNPAPGRVKEKKKRLIVEFAIENAQVVHRRGEREAKAQNQPVERREPWKTEWDDASSTKPRSNQKRSKALSQVSEDEKQKPDKLAQRQRIVAKKRALRKGKRKGAS